MLHEAFGPRIEAPPALPSWVAVDFPFRRRMFRYAGHVMHFVDDGVAEGGAKPAVVLQHGNPTWSYLWRDVMRRLRERSLRVVAADLVGLGLSDKPRDLGVHSLDAHARRLAALLDALALEEVVIVGQDWGGPIATLGALRSAATIRGAVFANTALRQPRTPPPTALYRLAHLPVVSDVAFRVLNLPVRLMPYLQGDASSLGPTQRRAYRFPLRRLRDRTAPLALARMVPLSLEHPTVAALGPCDTWARGFEGPVGLVWGMRDPILGPALRGMRALFPKASVTETGAGHFLQEEVPEVLAQTIYDVVAEVF